MAAPHGMVGAGQDLKTCFRAGLHPHQDTSGKLLALVMAIASEMVTRVTPPVKAGSHTAGAGDTFVS